MINLLRRLLGHNDKFFDLLETSAGEAQASVRHLSRMLRETDDVHTIAELVHSRRHNKRITGEISQALCRTFVTPFEREDIEALSFALYKIPKSIEKFGEKFLLGQPRDSRPGLDQQMALLGEAVGTVLEMVKRLRRHENLEVIQGLNDQLHQLEAKADRLMMDMTHELYSGRHEALRVIIALDLFRTLEKVVDRCRDAGNIVFQMVLKYS